jgi:hypothetical protein
VEPELMSADSQLLFSGSLVAQFMLLQIFGNM